MYRQGSSASLHLRLLRECKGGAVVALAWQSWKGQMGRDSYALNAPATRTDVELPPLEIE